MKTLVVVLLLAAFAICNVKCCSKFLFSLTLYDNQKVQLKYIVLKWRFIAFCWQHIIELGCPARPKSPNLHLTL